MACTQSNPAAFPAEQRSVRTAARFPLLPVSAVLVYALLTGVAVFRHEPWADEAQAWLLARDSSLWALWTRLLHYEGSPGLWHTLLHLSIVLGAPYGWLNLFSGLLGLGSAILLFWCSPFPLLLRLLLPFTYFLCYQYAVIARSYSLLPALLFACAAVFRDAEKRMVLLTALLCLMADVSVHGLVLSCAIWGTLQLSMIRKWQSISPAARKRWIVTGAIYLLALSCIVWSAWPAGDVTFVTKLNPSSEHFFQVSRRMVTNAFTGNWWLSLAAVALSLPSLWKGKALFVFMLSSASLCLVSSVIYSQVWHDGILFLVWIFALWRAATFRQLDWAALAALSITVAFQCHWTAESIRYDFPFPYSGSKAAAQYLRENNIPSKTLYGIGYACTGVQPYFAHNIFANFSGGDKAAYWDWSSRNHIYVHATEHLAQEAPEYVLVGYKTLTEKYLYDYVAQSSGYSELKHFQGNLFWQDEVFEPEAFDLYRRTETRTH